MSTPITRHYPKNIIAHKDVICNKIKHFNVLNMVFVKFSYSILKMEQIISISVSDYLKPSFIVLRMNKI